MISAEASPRTTSTRRLPLDDDCISEIQRLAQLTENESARALLNGLAHKLSTDPRIVNRSAKPLSPNAAAEKLGVSRTYVNKLLKEGKLEYFMVGSHKRIPAAALNDFIETREQSRRTYAEQLAARDTIEANAFQEMMDLM